MKSSGSISEYQITPEFTGKYRQVRASFFSRSPELWPCYRDPGFMAVNDFRRRCAPPEEQLKSYPGGDDLLERLRQSHSIPPVMHPPDGTVDPILQFAGALSKNWEHPASVENVVTMSSDPGVYGTMMGALANPNLVYSEYSGMADQLEKAVIRMMADLAGYNPEQATGIFTQGGTFCNLYGYLAGIRKSLPEAKENGMGYIHDYRVINSYGGHYSNITNLSLLGVDIRNRTIRIKINENNDIDFDDLERQMTACFNLKCVVPTIMLTMGTTDTFGVDQVKPVHDLVNRLCDFYDITVKPHIHVDSAIGWSMLFFVDYDFVNNPLGINQAALAGIRRNAERFKELKYADSFTVDFQKWGYVPYTSSLVMFKNSEDLVHLQNDPGNFSYFERDLQGHTHLQSTIECSRGAAGVFGAFAALRYMGVEGYRTIIAHCLQNAEYFRFRLNQLGCAKVIAAENHGPSVGFRLYNPAVVEDPEAEFRYEYAIQNTDEYCARLGRNSSWHRQLFLEREKVGLFTNWVMFVAHTAYDQRNRFHKLPGEKAVFMNPLTTRKEIDQFIDQIECMVLRKEDRKGEVA